MPPFKRPRSRSSRTPTPNKQHHSPLDTIPEDRETQPTPSPFPYGSSPSPPTPLPLLLRPRHRNQPQSPTSDPENANANANANASDSSSTSTTRSIPTPISTWSSYKPHAELNKTTDVYPDRNFDVMNIPAFVTELHEMMAAQGPIEPLLAQAQRGVGVVEMMNVLLDAETALWGGDVDVGKAKTLEGMAIAGELRDREYLERCDFLLGWVDEIRRKRGENIEGTGPVAGVKWSGEVSVPGSRNGTPISRPGSGSWSGSGSGEVLGDFLQDIQEEEGEKEEGEREGDEGELVGECDNHQHIAYDGDNDSSGTENEHNGRFLVIRHDATTGQIEEEDEDDDYDFDPRIRPETSLSMRSPSTDEEQDDESEHEVHQDVYFEQEVEEVEEDNDWQNHSDSDSDSDSNSNSNSEQETEDHSIPESDYYADSSSAEDDSMSAQNIRKRRRPPICSTNLTYSFLCKMKKPKSKSKTKEPKKLSPHPKPWIQLDETTDFDDSFTKLYWNTHSPSMLMQERIPNWDMDWLARYETFPSKVRRVPFTFRVSIPMSQMASRVRKTKIFPEQDWEFIAKKKDWERFQKECGDEELTMGFLKWERERIQMSVAQKHEAFSQTDYRATAGAAAWAWVVVLGVVGFVLFCFVWLVFRLL
ncbi:hypothetical protein BDW59DRAFT_165632 [Aspergillus cavernicola]|uniref:Uncharacterized protein n=1 Tax=Aspergillus cavernicola TaxID=176166 RepID=A0ABR4HRR3_9EURO